MVVSQDMTAAAPKADGLSFLAVVRHGIGLATDLYDLSIINCIRAELVESEGHMSNSMDGAITAATTAGAMVGQLAFGYFADVIGRRKTFIATSMLLCVSALGCACSTQIGRFSTYEVLVFWRFMLGVGVGGEYPLSAAVTAEEAAEGKSSTGMALTYSMFCFGQLLGPFVVIALIYAGASAEITWRLSLGGGAVLALTGTILRCGTMHESKAWLEAKAHTQHINICSATSLRALGRPLLGTMLIYFLYDVVSWGVGGYTTTIFKDECIYNATTTIIGTLETCKPYRINTLWYTQLVNVMAIPGFIMVLWIGRFGRKTYQIVGFFGMTCCFVAVGLTYGRSSTIVIVLIFGFQKIFDSFGPGATTYIIPGEIFPSSVRATCHGASAAAGKLGAFVGLYGFPAVTTAIGKQGTFFIGGALLATGALLTTVLTPSYDDATLTRLRAATQKDITRTTEVLWPGKDSSTESVLMVDSMRPAEALITALSA